VNQLVHTIFGHKFHVSNYDRKTRYYIKYRRNDEKSCLIFYFDDDLSNLYIVSLAKCGTQDDLRSGTSLLNMVDALARLIPECKTIALEDASTVHRCSYPIDLACLTIFLTGISWYNRLGYKQPSYESDNEHNRRIRNMHLRDAITELLASPKIMKDYPKFVKYKQELDTKLKLENPDLTVAEYIKILYDDIKPYPEDEDECIQRKEHNAKMVSYVINAFGNLLQYHQHVLIKDVVHGKHIPPFIHPSTMTAFEFEPEDVFNCGECGRGLRGDDLPPWNAEPKGVKYYATRGHGEDEELICHECATVARSPKASSKSPMASKSPKASSRSPKASSRSPKASSAPGGGARKSRATKLRCNPRRRTRRRVFHK
jgi:hypothetical protein